MSEFPEGMIPCDELLQCVHPDVCDSCGVSAPENPFSDAPDLVRGRVYRAAARTPPSWEGTQGWWIPELYSESRTIVWGPQVIQIWLLWCAPHFAPLNEPEKIPEALERILKIRDHGPAPKVREPEKV